MLSKITSIFGLVIVLLGIALYAFILRSNRLQKERDTYKQNTHSLLSDIKQIQIDSGRMATDVRVLKLTLHEYEEYRAEDLKMIKDLKAKVKSMQVAAKHELEIKAPISAELRDTIILRDTTIIPLKTIEVKTPFLQISGMIENNRITGEVFLPVNLNQIVWVEPKHRFLWWNWGVKAVHQTGFSDNPHVRIKYTEYIIIQK